MLFSDALVVSQSAKTAENTSKKPHMDSSDWQAAVMDSVKAEGMEI